MKVSPGVKVSAILLFFCIFCWIAAVSVERSMRQSGVSKEQGSGARKANLQESIERQKSDIAALPEPKTAGDRLTRASELEVLASLLWQDQRLKEALDALTKALALERQGGAPKDRVIQTLNQIAAVCRDSNNYSDMRIALKRVQTLNLQDPLTPPEVLIRDKQNMLSCNFLLALAESDPAKRKQQLQLTQTTMHELKKEFLKGRAVDVLSPSEKSLCATIDENLASVCEELEDPIAAKPLKDEAQTLRSALH